MKKATLILGLISGLFLLNSSKPYTSDNNSPKTRLDSLMSKKWKFNISVETYHRDTIISISPRSSGKNMIIRYVYYLTDDISKMGVTSEEIESNFDWPKVGKSVKGKFLVTFSILDKPGDEKYGACRRSEILELTDTKLVLRAVHSSGESAMIPDLVYSAEPLD